MARGLYGYLAEGTNQSLCVYRYIDVDDGIIKYVGIVKKALLSDRIAQHRTDDNWCKNKVWRIEYFKCETQSEVEAFEAHLISLYGTDKYYNKQKTGWGINKYLPDVEDWWKVAFSSPFNDSETMRTVLYIKHLIREGRKEEAKKIIDEDLIVNME